MPAALYERLAGNAWDSLDVAVRRAHLSGDFFQVRGVFRVWRGQNGLARLLAWLARLPPASEATPIQLTVRPFGDGEQWERLFDDRPLVSRQREAGPGVLSEWFGPVEFRFQVVVVEGAIRYALRQVALLAGPLRLPLPRWLSPRLEAGESRGRDEHQAYIRVTVTLPLVGLLVGYEGTLDV